MVKKRGRNAKPIPLEVNLDIASESEVSIGGDAHRVSIRSKAPVESLVAYAEHLYKSCPPSGDRGAPMGFGVGHIEHRETPVPPGSTMAYPILDK